MCRREIAKSIAEKIVGEIAGRIAWRASTRTPTSHELHMMRMIRLFGERFLLFYLPGISRALRRPNYRTETKLGQ